MCVHARAEIAVMLNDHPEYIGTMVNLGSDGRARSGRPDGYARGSCGVV